MIQYTSLGIPYTNDFWNKFGPYSCLLNIDEVEDLEATWQSVADQVGMYSISFSSTCNSNCINQSYFIHVASYIIGVDKKQLVENITIVRDMYIVCDHSRSVLIAIEDGSLPSNVSIRSFISIHHR